MIKMKLKQKTDSVEFLKSVRNCRGEVFLKTSQGDSLNLSSELSGYVMLFLLSKEDMVKDAWIECSLPDDEEILGKFIEHVPEEVV